MVATTPDQHALLSRECADAEAVWRRILSSLDNPNYLAESPIKPWILDQAQLVLIYRMRKTSCLVGAASGGGVVIARLPSAHRDLFRWSAPLFVKVSLTSFGLSFGKSNAATFAVATARDAAAAFTADGGRRLLGLDFGAACGASLQDRGDALAANLAGPDVGLVGVSAVSGAAIDASLFAAGAMRVDAAKCAAAYGAGAAAAPAAILARPGPPEFSPLFGELSRVVATVEHPQFGPGRVSASLERYSVGSDPDRVMVLPTGVIVRDDLKEPPKERLSAASSLSSV